MKRLPAEWEPQSAVQLTWPDQRMDWHVNWEASIRGFRELIRSILGFQRVLVVCHSEKEFREFFPKLDARSVSVYEISCDDTWTRDYGGITILDEENIFILDFCFNGWGGKFPAGKDNRVTSSLFDQGAFKVNGLRTFDFVLEGGSIESDGRGALLTTKKCLLNPNRNPNYSQREIEDLLFERLGSSRILWLDHGYLAGDDTDSHIDTLARFCDPDTIAFVACEDPNDEHFDELRMMKEELAALRTVAGNPYRLAPLPMPDPVYSREGRRLPATYANFLILNGGVLVPTYGLRQDQMVLKIMRQLFQNRRIVGVDCRPFIEQHGSLHCLTMQYPQGVVK